MDYSPIIISLQTAALSIVLTFILGLVAGYAVYSMRNETLKLCMDGLFTLPMVLPPTVAGFFLLQLFGVKRPFGAFLLERFAVKIAFTWWATVLAAVVISFPLMYRSVRGALEQVDVNLVYAGRTLGLSELHIMRCIVLPNAWPGIVSGAVLSFARGLGEFGATAMIAGNIAGKTRTLPVAVYSAVAAGDMDLAYRYVCMLVAISFLILATMNVVSMRRNNEIRGNYKPVRQTKHILRKQRWEREKYEFNRSNKETTERIHTTSSTANE